MAGGGVGTAGADAASMDPAAVYDGVNAAANPSMPQWQRGLMGLVTGSPKYGQNAPAIHGAMGGLLGQLAKPATGPAPMPAQRPPMGATPPISSFTGQPPQTPMPNMPMSGAMPVTQAPWMQNGFIR